MKYDLPPLGPDLRDILATSVVEVMLCDFLGQVRRLAAPALVSGNIHSLGRHLGTQEQCCDKHKLF